MHPCIDTNSLKHIGVCALGSFIGTHGAAFVMGAAICKEWDESKAMDTGVAGI